MSKRKAKIRFNKLTRYKQLRLSTHHHDALIASVWDLAERLMELSND
jgi:hypothetical protein